MKLVIGMGAGAISKWMTGLKYLHYEFRKSILLKKFGIKVTATNVNLSNYSWFNLGGNAEYFL